MWQEPKLDRLPRLYLIERRKIIGLEVKDIAEQLKVSKFYYYQIENGRRGHRINWNLFTQISQILKIKPEDLLMLELKYRESLSQYT